MIHLSKQTAKRYLLEYQNLSRPRILESDEEILCFIRKVGCIQYDPLSKVAKNADLVLQSRCKNYTEETLYRLLYEKRELIDGWDKNMSIWSVSDWPCFARKRARFAERYQAGSAELQEVRNDILHTVKTEGSVSSREVYGNRKVDWAWAPTDIGRAALESMYHGGELVIHHKEGTRKYYGLTEELLPPEIVAAPDPNKTLEEYQEWYVVDLKIKINKPFHIQLDHFVI